MQGRLRAKEKEAKMTVHAKSREGKTPYMEKCGKSSGKGCEFIAIPSILSTDICQTDNKEAVAIKHKQDLSSQISQFSGAGSHTVHRRFRSCTRIKCKGVAGLLPLRGQKSPPIIVLGT